jgi:hypothetical protein
MFRTALISMFLTSTALATTWTVDDDGKADFDNIQAAVDASSDGDEIIVMPGTYASTADEVVNMLGKAVWLHSSGGQEVTIIDGEGLRRGILCNSDETNKTIIEGFTIAGGYSILGGGMNNYYSSPTLTDCTFTNNTSLQLGGGMYNWNSNPTLINCEFTSNTANDGGGMFNSYSNTTLTNCTFENNTTDNYGGGMCNSESSPTLTDCIFTNNTAANYGGGMYNYESSPTLTDTTVCGNIPDQIDGDWIDNGGNTVSDECPDCPDINSDGYVNVSDLLAVIDQWGLTNSPADVNDDGIVDVSDLLIVIDNWGACE